LQLDPGSHVQRLHRGERATPHHRTGVRRRQRWLTSMLPSSCRVSVARMRTPARSPAVVTNAGTVTDEERASEFDID
jgi:hypothetical protein